MEQQIFKRGEGGFVEKTHKCYLQVQLYQPMTHLPTPLLMGSQLVGNEYMYVILLFQENLVQAGILEGESRLPGWTLPLDLPLSMNEGSKIKSQNLRFFK